MSPRSGRASRTAGIPRSALVILVTTGVLLSGCTSGSDQTTDSSPSPVTPRQAHLDLSRLPVPRVDFCDVLSEDDVAAALGGPVAGTAHYGNGDEVEVRPGYVDVSHEYGCVFEGEDGAAAQVWVFARPVSRKEARAVVRRARRGRDCAFPRSVVFGTPGLASVCEASRTSEASGSDDRIPTVRARLEGLFGDSWLGCEVSEPLSAAGEPDAASSSAAPRADVVHRAEQWCTEVVTTVSASF